MSGEVVQLLAAATAQQSDQLGAGSTVVVTFAGALLGSAAAVAAQAWLTRRGSERHFRSLVAAMRLELETIKGESLQRASRPSADVRLDPLYPTLAWQTLVASPEVRRLGDLYVPLAGLYAIVDAANHRTGQVAILLQTSATAANDELRLQYRNLAQQFAGPANDEVVRSLDPAFEALQKLGR